jgi:hypothetical protein
VSTRPPGEPGAERVAVWDEDRGPDGAAVADGSPPGGSGAAGGARRGPGGHRERVPARGAVPGARRGGRGHRVPGAGWADAAAPLAGVRHRTGRSARRERGRPRGAGPAQRELAAARRSAGQPGRDRPEPAVIHRDHVAILDVGADRSDGT